MPELPEVEFAARHLRRWLVGRRVVGVVAQPGTPLRDLTPEALAFGLRGRVATGVRRHGKQMFVDLDDGAVWAVHLGMTGKFVRRATDEEPRAGSRVQVRLADADYALDFVDPRRFGRLRLFASGAEAAAEIARLGPDALELCADPPAFAARLGAAKPAIKVALMDQARLAGVGNIYACEGLHDAGVDPWARACDLPTKALEALAVGVREAMLQSLERETDDEITYLQAAKARNPFRVYGRLGLGCTCCGAPVERGVQQGRATFWTPDRQTVGRRKRKRSR